MASLNLMTDILVVCLPLPLLWNLQMRRGMKLQVIGIFSVGSLWVAQHLLVPVSGRTRELIDCTSASIISIYRIPQLLVLSGNFYDPSWDRVAPSLWSNAELAALTLGACAITYRPLFNSIFGIKTRPVGFQRRLVSAKIQTPPQPRAASESKVGMDLEMQHRDFIDLLIPTLDS